MVLEAISKGLEHIAAANGWAMALTGACIVMIGLTVLSFIISNLHRLVEIIESPDKKGQIDRSTIDKDTSKNLESIDLLSDVAELKKIYTPLIKKLEQPFQLSKLYDLSEKNQLPHTHLTIKVLRQEGVLTPMGDGAYTWNQ